MTDFYWECNETAKAILQALAMGIGLEDENYFLSSHTGHHNQLRLLHYLPVPSTDYLGDTETRSRLSAHTDWASITMVFQDDCGGLQVCSVSFHCIPFGFIYFTPVWTKEKARKVSLPDPFTWQKDRKPA
jgi:isopenicillin N synthase-like dioxygenase